MLVIDARNADGVYGKFTLDLRTEARPKAREASDGEEGSNE